MKKSLAMPWRRKIRILGVFFLFCLEEGVFVDLFWGLETIFDFRTGRIFSRIGVFSFCVRRNGWIIIPFPLFFIEIT